MSDSDQATLAGTLKQSLCLKQLLILSVIALSSWLMMAISLATG